MGKLRAALLTAAIAVSLAACSSSSDNPQVLPTLTATPTPSASAAAVVVPPAARLQTPVGAVAFVRYYYEQLNVAWSTPNSQVLAALSDPACGTCKNYIAAADRFGRLGQHVRGPSVRLLSAEAPPLQNGLIAVDTYLEGPARSVVRRDGALIKSLPLDPRYHRTVYVVSTARGWRLRAVKAAT